MKISEAAALAIRAAYRSGIINFTTYCEIKKKYTIDNSLSAKKK